jgi:FtsH-binding integral membrane protein
MRNFAVPSVFLLNAAILFSGVVAFIIAGFAGTFMRSLHPWRYRLMLAPLGFVVCGGISISAEQHLLRWIQHGHLQHSLSSGIVQGIVLIIGGLCGLLAGLGLGSSLDRTFPDVHSYSIANYWGPRETKPRTPKAKVVPISRGRQPSVVPQIKAISHRD